MASQASGAPAWQTDELADEWVEEEEEEIPIAEPVAPQQQSTQAIHSTFNAHTSRNFGTTNVYPQDGTPDVEQTTQVGTFVVHSEQPSAQLPQTPAFGKKKGQIKDIFSPLALERLFEPPSPPKHSLLSTPTPQQRVASTSHHLVSNRPVNPSKLSQVVGASTVADESEIGQSKKQQDEIVETDVPNVVAFGDAMPSPACCFTFSVPRSNQRFPARINFGTPAAATSTPNNDSTCRPQPQTTPFPSSRTRLHTEQQTNSNDSRLRLFRFQYDTFTREHLSAIVDSFGVSSPSNVSNSRQSVDTVFYKPPSNEEEQQEDPETFSRLRAAKRLKLTPPDELTQESTVRLPPQGPRGAVKRDYVGEARSFMQKIRRARGMSLVSTAGAAEQEPVHPNVLIDSTNTRNQGVERVHSDVPSTPTINTNNVFGSKFPSTAYRKQAEDLMAKIKGDPRMVSGRGDTSMASQKSDDDYPKMRERSWAPSPETRPVSPVKKQLEETENHDPELEAEPPSYAASIALTREQFDAQFALRNQPLASAGANTRKIVVMPVTIPEEVSPIAADRIRSPNPTFLAPPPTALGNALFNAQKRTLSTNEDLNRLVSSGSTATTATTLTMGSAGSGVKHAGPAQMVRIAPADLPSIPERVGGMIFDRKLGRWVKERGASDKTVTGSFTRRSSQGSFAPAEGFTESEDPFRDIESLHDEGSNHSPPANVLDNSKVAVFNRNHDGTDGTDDMHIISSDSDSDFDDEEDTQISTFTFDRPPTGVVKVITSEAGDLSEIDEGDATTDSEDNLLEDHGNAGMEGLVDDDVYDHLASMSIQEEQQLDEGASIGLGADEKEPYHDVPESISAQKRVESAVTPSKPPRKHVQPPRSALKSASVTPISRGGRTVSFSDGRKDGKIIGLHARQGNEVATRSAGVPSSALFPASARTNRIMEMLEDVEESLQDDEDHNCAQEYMRPETMPYVSAETQKNMSFVESSPRSFTRSQTIRRPGQSSPRHVNTPSRVNATFLTECSFGVAHDRLVEVITDVQPFEPYWESLSSIDLSGRRLDSVERLKEFLPKLDSLNLNNNLLSWLSGIPGTVRTLAVASNALTSLTSFGHLRNLENLDISDNDIDSLQQLKCLRHLRELRADGNKITKLDGLEDFDGLLKLSLHGNQLIDVDLSGFRWSRLELLNLSNNRLESIRELNAVPSLVSLNLDNNFLSELDQPEDQYEQGHDNAGLLRILPKLRILRLSGNRLKHLNADRFPNLRTLYVDNNCLAEGRVAQRGRSQTKSRQKLRGLQRLCKLENFSARNQSLPGMRDSGLQLHTSDVRDVKRLYLSGNPSPIPLGTNAQACYNLVYLELAACRLTSLPTDFSLLMPNIRALNLNYNFLETGDIASGLVGLKRLRKLTVVGSRMTGTKALIKMLSVMGEYIELLDFRMNPCTLGWYLPLLVQDKDNGALLQPSEPANGRQHLPFVSALPPSSKTPAAITDDVQGALQQDPGNIPSSSAAGTIDSSPKCKDKRSQSHWEALDAQFRRGLPDRAYAGRLAYRGLVMRACPQIKILDGVRVTEKEKRKAEALLKRVLKGAVTTAIPSRATEQR